MASSEDANSSSSDGYTVLDLTNDNGQGFHMHSLEGYYVFPLPPELLGGLTVIDKLKGVKNAKVQQDDIVLSAYPKCGTHWVWEILEMLKGGVVKHQELVKETRNIEFIFKEGIEALTKPRVFNTHLPMRILPREIIEKKVKCIRVLRNPKDVCVSYYNHLKKMALPVTYNGSFDEFVELFLKGHVPSGSYYQHLQEWNAALDRCKVLPVITLYYEDIKQDPVGCVKKLAGFLEVTVTDQLCKDIADACSFLNMKKDEKVKKGLPFDVWKQGSDGTVFRKGQVGDWKNWFTVAQNERFDSVWNEKMKGMNYQFTY